MASLQQVVEQLVLLAANGDDATAPLPPSPSGPSGPLELVVNTTQMLFSASALRDWAILLVIGSLFETARRLLASLWRTLISAFFITAVFEEDDASFQWIMHWLSMQPSWQGARNVQISTSNFDLHTLQLESENSNTYERKVTYIPAVSESYTLWHKYRWMGVTRTVEAQRGGWATRERLTMSILTRDHAILAGILQEAKTEYIEAQKDKITIFVSDRYHGGNGWRELASRPKRPLNSIILDPGITELVVEDVQDFLNSKQWYAERGIPFRRGYLLYGAPGSGKTSLIHSIAGELGLNVYIISLSRSGLDDTGLAELISALPERCIALMEDIDAAFHHGLSRENSQGTDSDEPANEADPNAPPPPNGNHVSLSGLLNALDGIGAQEGRVLFATTNKYQSLDPALCRPGRMDLHIEFKLASRFQAEELFKRFYGPSATKLENGHVEEVTENGRVGDLVDLSEASPPSQTPSEKVESSVCATVTDRPHYVGVVHGGRGPVISQDRVHKLAAQFAHAVPERQLSVASLQGFLMMHKTRPVEAAAAVGAWVEKELKEREGK